MDVCRFGWMTDLHMFKAVRTCKTKKINLQNVWMDASNKIKAAIKLLQHVAASLVYFCACINILT